MGSISINEMKRVVLSLYIDIPDAELDNQNPYFWDKISKSERTKISFKENYSKLLEVKQYPTDKAVENRYMKLH